MFKLSENEIRKRLREYENLKKCHTEMKERKEKRELKYKERIAKLEAENKEQKVRLETLELQVEELKKYLFKFTTRKNGTGQKNDTENIDTQGAEKETEKEKKTVNPRDPSSYRRQKPAEEDVDEEVEYDIEECPKCTTKLTKKRACEFFEEDIKELSAVMRHLKRIQKQFITTGYCKKCKNRVSAKPIPKQQVFLGENIRRLVVYFVVIQDLSYSQAQAVLEDLANMKVSSGEITKILEKEANKLEPAFHELEAKIREGPAHYDETSWKVTQEKNEPDTGGYAWIKTSAEKGNMDTIFLLGKNRGKGNAERLRGEGESAKNQVGISDDYPGYHKTFKHHQLCWSHPLRKFRDIKNSKSLETNSPEKLKHCERTYRLFAKLYEDLEKVLATKYDKERWDKKREELLGRLECFCKPRKQDPEKIQTIRKTLLKRKERYLTCLQFPGIPADNNKAERNLRHLVLRRKKTFGSKTKKGADMMSILYSVILSLWWSNPENFWHSYENLV